MVKKEKINLENRNHFQNKTILKLPTLDQVNDESIYSSCETLVRRPRLKSRIKNKNLLINSSFETSINFKSIRKCNYNNSFN